MSDDDYTIKLVPDICNKCGKEIESGYGFHLTPDTEGGFHLHTKCLKALLKYLIKDERNKSEW